MATTEHQVVKTVKTTTCDLCGEEAKRRCVLCRRDLCWDHVVLDPRDGGDYPPEYCKSCWDVGESFRKQMDEIERRRDDEIEKLERDWDIAAKELVRNAPAAKP